MWIWTSNSASSVSEQSEARNAESPPGSVPLSSEGSERPGWSDARPKTLVGATSPQGEATRSGSAQGQTAGRSEWQWFAEKEGGGQKGAEDLGLGHLRSYSHPTSLKYWRDRPNSSLSLPAGRVAWMDGWVGGLNGEWMGW